MNAVLVKRRRTALLVVAPIAAVATLMLGLRVGAGDAVRAASVIVAPAGTPPTSGAPVPLAWQILTYLEDRGVRETIPIADLTVIARSKGHEARWTGASNIDGVAEASLALPDFVNGDPVAVEVLTAGESAPLATGLIDTQTQAPAEWARPTADDGARAAVRPQKREGALGIDVVIEGERLIVGFPTPVWVHLTAPGLDTARPTVEATPEAGLRIDRPPVVGCGGWALIDAVAEGHVVGMGVSAKDATGRTGAWFGALPVAAGAFFVGMPGYVQVGENTTATLVAPNPRNVVYAEVDDERGRVHAAALRVAVEAGDPTPRARFAIPPLAAGLHWLVVSGEPRGAERLLGAAIAKPFLVGEPRDAAGVDPRVPCSLGPWLARRPAFGFPRRLGLDGMETRGARNRMRHRAGLFIGLFSLFAAAVLEILLLTAASREARAALLLAELDDPNEAARVTAKTPGGGLVVALLVALLGFALLAALMIAKA